MNRKRREEEEEEEEDKEEVAKDIIKAAASIKKKLKDLKKRKAERDREVRENFGPIVEPLEKLAKYEEETKRRGEFDDEDDTYIDPHKVLANVTDKTFGPRYVKKKKSLMLGNKPYHVSANKIFVGKASFPRTRGLAALIERAHPEKEVEIAEEDEEMYRTIMESTNLHRAAYSPTGKPKSSSGTKYKTFIQPYAQREKLGLGYYKTLECSRPNATTIIHWTDPNRLCDRLRLLVASQEAGHTNHKQEIEGIITELRTAGYLE